MNCPREDPLVQLWDQRTCKEEVPSIYEPDPALGPAVKVVLDQVGWMDEATPSITSSFWIRCSLVITSQVLSSGYSRLPHPFWIKVLSTGISSQLSL
jgi:hypothetical protein